MRLALAGFVVVSLAACNALTGADSLVAEETRSQSPANQNGSSSGTSGTSGVGSSGTSGSSGSSGTSGSSGSSGTSGTNPPPPDAGSEPIPDPSKTIVVAKFDSSAECMSWTASGPATRTYDEKLGRTAAGACVLCATDVGDIALERSGNSPIGGKLGAAAYVRRPPAKTTPPGFTFTAIAVAGTISTSQTFSAGDTWTTAGTKVSASIQKDESVTIRVSVTAAKPGECIVVDDVTVFVQ